MVKYVLKRTFWALITLLAVVTVTFFLMRSIPGDPLAGMARALPEKTKAAFMAKKALMRSVDERNEDPFWADLELEMLEKVNQLGIGPQGFGGKTTALCVNIEKCPTHIAGLPIAVNINCHVTRHKTEVL